jgi:sugar/nucleoside kinase (ribokinase family)
LSGMVRHSVVTDGPNGAFIHFDGTSAHIPAFPCHPKDLTGAGDMFAGAFLYGITHGYLPKVAARGANYLSMKVISQVGARLHQGVQGYWKEGIA